jgi:hypothetical protein
MMAWLNLLGLSFKVPRRYQVGRGGTLILGSTFYCPQINEVKYFTTKNNKTASCLEESNLRTILRRGGTKMTMTTFAR